MKTQTKKTRTKTQTKKTPKTKQENKKTQNKKRQNKKTTAETKARQSFGDMRHFETGRRPLIIFIILHLD